MSKFIILSKEFEKRQTYVRRYINQQVYHSFIKDSRLTLVERQINYLKKNSFSYSSSIVRLKNYCTLTGHSRSIYRNVKLSRHKFNTMVLNGLIPGCIWDLGRINEYNFVTISIAN